MNKTTPNKLMSPFLETPQIIVEQRKDICKCNCNINFLDPCVSCPKNNWGPFMCYSTESNEGHQKFPSFAKQASNFLTAIKDETKSIISGDNSISEEERNKRYEICKNCFLFDLQSKRCRKCGCYMPIKTSWRSQKCPIGKW